MNARTWARRSLTCGSIASSVTAWSLAQCVPLDSGSQVQNSIYLEGGAEWPLTAADWEERARRGARAGAVRLHRRRSGLRGDDAREPRGLRATPAATADAHRATSSAISRSRCSACARRSRSCSRRSASSRSPTQTPSSASPARPGATGRADDPLERRVELARGRRRGARRHPALVPALLVRRPRARRQHRRPGRRGGLRRDRRHPRHADARLAAARPTARLSPVPPGRRARAVLQRPRSSAPPSTRRRKTTSSRPPSGRSRSSPTSG